MQNDVLKENKQKKYLIISGVHKAGTTSLFNYLANHPEINASKKKEIHFFTPLRFSKPIDAIEKYHAYFDDDKQTVFNMEASPSYLYGGRPIINEIQEHLGANVKTILILRNPTDRFISFYNHGKYTLDLPKNLTLAKFIKQSLTAVGKPLEDTKISRGIREGFYVDHLPDWINSFGKATKIIFFEDFKLNPKKTVEIICNWLAISNECYSEFDFSIENETANFQNKAIHQFSIAINKVFEQQFIKFPGIKRALRKWYKTLNTNKLKKDVSNENRALLDSIYSQKNSELREYLINNNLVDRLPNWL